MMARLPEFFDGQPSVDTPRGKISLFAALRAPIDASPFSLEGQLEIIRDVWAPLLGDRVALLNRLLNKSAISAEKDGRRYLYAPILQRDAWVQGESESLLARMFGGKEAMN